MSFNAVDVTVLNQPNTGNSFFHPPPRLALDFLPTQTSNFDFGVSIFFNTKFNSGTKNFPTSSGVRFLTENPASLPKCLRALIVFFKNV